MLKLIKFFLILLSFLLVVLIATPFFVDINDYKPEISKAVKDATGRDLQIGHIKLSLFPWVGVRLNQVQLQNAAGFEQPYMLTVKSINVQLELIPLFSKKIEVKRFALDTPKVYLEQRIGSNNWDDLTTSPAANVNTSPTLSASESKQKPSAKSSNLASQIALNAKLLSISNGRIEWIEPNAGKLTLSDIQLDVTDLQLERPIGINLSARVGGQPLKITAQVGPVLDFNNINFEELPILAQLKANSFELTSLAPWLPVFDEAQIEQFGDLKTAKVDADISLEQHNDSRVRSTGYLSLSMKQQTKVAWILDAKDRNTIHIQSVDVDINQAPVLALSGDLRQLQSEPRYELRFETEKLQRLWLNPLLPQLQQLYSDNPKPWRSIKLGALVAGDSEILDIRNLQLELDDEPVQMSGNMALGKDLDIQLRVSANTLHLDPWLPKSKAVPIENAAPIVSSDPLIADQQPQLPPEDIEPDLTFIKPWYVSLQFNAKAVHILNLTLDDLRLTLSSEKGVVRLNPLSFGLGEGRVAENFILYANQYPATWKESMNMTGVAVQPVLKALADFSKLSGTAQLNTNLSGKGLLPDAIIAGLNGRGQFVFEDGKFEGVDIAKTVRKLQKDDAQAGNSTDFAQMQGSFRIVDGVLNNNDLYMASPLFRLTGQGRVNFKEMALDYHVRPRLIDSITGQGGNQKQKGLVVPLHIFGPFEKLDVSVEVDRDALLESAAALNKKAGDKIGGVAGQVLEQGFVETREEQKQKAEEAIQQKLNDEKARAKEKLQNALKGFKF